MPSNTTRRSGSDEPADRDSTSGGAQPTETDPGAVAQATVASESVTGSPEPVLPATEDAPPTPSGTTPSATRDGESAGSAPPGLSAPAKAPTKRAPTKRTPAKTAAGTASTGTAAKRTPTKAATPTKATPTKATPTKATPTKATPAKATPTTAGTPAKAAPRARRPAKSTTAAKGTPATTAATLTEPAALVEPVSTTGAPVETTTGAPLETSTGAPLETSTGAPLETSTGAPLETSTGAPLETSTGAPLETSTGAPLETSTGAPLETTAGAPLATSEASGESTTPTATPAKSAGVSKTTTNISKTTTKASNARQPARSGGKGPGGRGPSGKGASGKGPAGKGGGRGRQPVKVVRAGIPWASIALSGIVAVISLSIVGYGIWYSWDASKPFGERHAQQIDGLVNYRAQHVKWLTRVHRTGNLTYRTSPPVGGDHNPTWESCDGEVYSQQIPNEHAVHALEHGAVWITYRPDLPQAQINELARKVKGNDYMFMSPYPGLNKPISLQAWGLQLKLDNASDSRVDKFISNFRQTASVESGASCSSGVTVTGTTPTVASTTSATTTTGG